MLDTDGSTGTGSSGSDSSGTTATTSPTTTMSTSATTSPTTTSPTTTVDPDTSTSEDPPGTETGNECPPGELDCPCDVGSTCTGELICEDGTCVGEPACEEPEGEPNDDEASAVELAEVTCGQAAMTTMGGLGGAESDWFSYHAVDAIACGSNPDVSVTADVDVAVCVYVDCDNDQTSVNCSGGSDDTSPDGLEGCCDQNAVDLGFDCGGFPLPDPRDATIYVRLTSIDAACTPYEMAFDY